MSENELSALISLIDDPDPGVYQQVRERIISLGHEVVPALEQAWEKDDLDDIARDRVEDLLHTIHIEGIGNSLKEWVRSGGEDLLDGALVVARYRYAELDTARVRAKLNAIRQDIWLELNDHLTAFEKVRVFNHILFQVHGFKGNKRNYHAPKNSYLNEVLDSKKGNPLSLAMIYQILAEELDLPMRGVNLPNHFILAYMDEESVGGNSGDDEKHNVLFYVNAFSQGDILTKHEIDEFLKKLHLDPQATFYSPCSNVEIIQRVLNNLEHSYKKLGDDERSADMALLRSFAKA